MGIQALVRTVFSKFYMIGLLAGLAACAAGSPPLDVPQRTARVAPGACGISSPIKLASLRGRDGGTLYIRPPALLDREMAMPLAAWEADLGRAAKNYLNESVVSLVNISSYSCRKIRGGAGNRPARLSRHALGLALDISGFRLADGRLIKVAADWGRNTPRGRFLSAVHKAACRRFDIVLGPNYNRAHRDHFHVSMGGGGGFCR